MAYVPDFSPGLLDALLIGKKERAYVEALLYRLVVGTPSSEEDTPRRHFIFIQSLFDTNENAYTNIEHGAELKTASSSHLNLWTGGGRSDSPLCLLFPIGQI